jgi:hypothetical protein
MQQIVFSPYNLLPMRVIILFTLLLSVSGLSAQLLPGSFINNAYRGGFAHNVAGSDSAPGKKWFISKYSSISTSFTFFKGGSATVVAAPMGLQLNRRLNNNLYAFTGISLAPAYVNFNRSFLAADFSKGNPNNSMFKSSSLGIYSRAELGLQYINDDKTFSISGSIGIERNNYQMPFYNGSNNVRSNQVVSAIP